MQGNPFAVWVGLAQAAGAFVGASVAAALATWLGLRKTNRRVRRIAAKMHVENTNPGFRNPFHEEEKTK